MSALAMHPSALDRAFATDDPSRRARIAGWVVSGIAIALLLFDVVTKLLRLPAVVQGTVQAGFQPHHVPIIGAIGAVCLIVYLIPRLAPLGAVLWTGYLGGAVVTNLRLDMPLFTYILTPIYVAIFLWGGLYLRDARVRRVLGPVR